MAIGQVFRCPFCLRKLLEIGQSIQTCPDHPEAVPELIDELFDGD